MPDFRRVGIIYNALSPGATALAGALEARLSKEWSCWRCSSNEEARAAKLAPGTDVIIPVGGDGTILKVFRMVFPHSIPLLSVNTGHVGFMTEIPGDAALTQVPRYLTAPLRVERRATITAEVMERERPDRVQTVFHALNDIVVGRREVARVAHVEARVDGGLVTTYRADSVIVATATGSTGYALACGGPVMFPESEELLLVPVSPHLSLPNSLLVRPGGTVELKLISEYPGLASADGQVDIELEAGDVVRVRRGENTVLFLRDSEPSAFYANLTKRLQVR